jgi:CHAT domain
MKSYAYVNMDLHLFDYRVVDGAERFRVCAKTPAGDLLRDQAAEVLLAPEVRTRLWRLEERTLSKPDLIELGGELAKLLFPQPIYSLLIGSLLNLRDQGLRIRLRPDTYALADLPWEYVYLPPNESTIDGFLSLNRRVSLIRYEMPGRELGDLDPIGTERLRLVTILCDPNQPPEYPALQLEYEQSRIDAVMRDTLPGMFSVDFYPNARVEDLLDALEGDEAHVFHFAGHGRFEGALDGAYGSLTEKGSVVLMDDNRWSPYPPTGNRCAFPPRSWL